MENANNLYDAKDYKLARVGFEDLSRIAEAEDVQQDCLFNIASCLASEGDFTGALKSLSKIDTTNGSAQDLLYNKALCNYYLSNYKTALKQINELLSNCHEKYPDLSVTRNFTSPNQDNDKLNRLLQDSCVVEGINLKSAILYKLSDTNSEIDSISCLNELPFMTNPEQLDCVTLHNQAIYENNMNINLSLSKLIHLVELSKQADITGQENDIASLVPPETFRNLIILFISNGLLEVARKFMKTNENLIRKYLIKEWWNFLEIYLDQSSINANELIYRKLNNLLEQLFVKMKDNNDKQQGSETSSLLHKLNLIELAIIVAAQECLILWNTGQYQTLEKLLEKIVSNLPAGHYAETMWIKNTAHNLFMMDTRFSDCADLYEKLLPQLNSKSLIEVDPMVLGNLCVAYVLKGRNGEAEALMKDVEAVEASIINDDLEPTTSHEDLSHHSRFGSCLSYINLIIGTLYCVKFNYEFGLSRMFKSFVPMEDKLNSKTWFYVKRCILSLLDCHCKQMICIKDDLFQQVVSFLIQCEKHGLLIEAAEITTTTTTTRSSLTNSDNLTGQQIQAPFHGRNSVTYEARLLRSIVLTVIHD